MPRSGSGVYTLPQAPFTPNTVILSAAVNSDLSDIAQALTLSLATTGVSSMTGPIKAFAGSQANPGYAFASALSTGFFLSNANEISWVANGAVGAVFGASTTVTFNGNVIYSGGLSITGSVTVGSNLTVGGSLSASVGNFSSSLHATGQISTSASLSAAGGLYVGGGIVASSSVTMSGPVVVSASQSVVGGLYITGSLAVAGDTSLSGTNVTIGATAANVNIGAGAVVIATTSVDIAGFAVLSKQGADPTAVAVNKVALYVKADGFSSVPVPYFESQNLIPVPLMFTGGQCQLTKSGSSLLLSPFGGNRLTVNGVPCVIPDIGVSLPASNSAGVFVYIYAVATAGAISSLEMSTTAPTIQPGTGVKQKTGDATRTLVGAAFTDAGGAWADSDGKLWVLSYYNRRRKVSRTTLTVQQVTATANYIEVDASMRNQFINWADESIFVYSKMWLNNQVTNVGVFNQHELDGTTQGDSQQSTAINGIPFMMNNYSTFSGITEATGHYISMYARTIGGTTLTISLGASSKENTCIYINVNG